MSDSCAGACCSVFPMHKDFPMFTRKTPATGDQAYILDMLIPLTRRQAVARSRRLGYPDPPKYGPKYGLFTCKHWNEETRLCGDYENRPKMCADYPYGRACERGCGFTTERAHDGWEWDAEANGWRPTSNDNFLWDAEAGVLRPIPKGPPS